MGDVNPSTLDEKKKKKKSPLNIFSVSREDETNVNAEYELHGATASSNKCAATASS